MFGWLSSRRENGTDHFSAQHDSTLKLIAANLDRESAANLAVVNRRSHVLFTDPYQAVDIEAERLRLHASSEVPNWTSEDVSYALESRKRLYGDTVSNADYLRRLNYQLDHGDLGDDSKYSRVWRVIYEVSKRKHSAIPQYAADFKETLLKAALNNVDAAICADGKILDEPNDTTFDNISNVMYWVLVGHKFVKNARHSWDAVPVASLRACKRIFENFGGDADDAAHAVQNAVYGAQFAEHSTTTEDLVGMYNEIFQPDYFAGSIFGHLQGQHAGYMPLTLNGTPRGRHVAENMLDRVDFIMTPEIAQRLIPNQVPRMRAIYASFDRQAPF